MVFPTEAYKDMPLPVFELMVLSVMLFSPENPDMA